MLDLEQSLFVFNVESYFALFDIALYNIVSWTETMDWLKQLYWLLLIKSLFLVMQVSVISLLPE